MAILKRRVQPEPWSRHRERAKHGWLVPFIAIEWVWAWLAYWLSGWAFLEVLEYFGTLSVLLAVVSYFSESKDRIKQKHYQAWQVINSAQGKGGSGGRIDALEELHADGVPLVGVDVSGAFLQDIDLSRANLLRANFRAADVRGGNLSGAQMQYVDLASGNFPRCQSSKHLAKRDFVGCRPLEQISAKLISKGRILRKQTCATRIFATRNGRRSRV